MKKHITKENPCGALMQTFLFQFGTDEAIYSVSFRGVIHTQEISRILEAAHTQHYIRCAEVIHSYLDIHRLKYSNFISRTAKPQNHTVMKTADCLLHAKTCESIDKQIGRADVYYGIMDYQRQTNNGYCEGCYYALSRTSTMQKYPYEYHMICQTFRCSSADNSEQACFAIRTNKNRHRLYTLEMTDDQPVLATFGCVDMLRLLMHIRTVTTKQQAAELANR